MLLLLVHWSDVCQLRVARSCGCADEPWVLERLEAVLQPIMWRNDKISVGDELKLRPGHLT